MTPNRHRIQRQVLELTLGDARAAPGIQEQLARACREPLLAGMSAVFDAVAPAHQLLRLERLEIDVGRIAGGDWAPEFERRLLAELERQLHSHAAQTGPEHESQIDETGGGEFDAFVFFLRHGRLPWWSHTPDPAWTGAFTTTDARQMQALRTLLQEDPRAVMRLVNALDDAALEMLVAGLGPLRDCTLALHELRPADTAELNQRWRLKFWSTVVAGSLALRDGAVAASLVHTLMAQRCQLALEHSRLRPTAASESSGSGIAPLIRPVNLAALPAFWREHYAAALQQTDYAASPAAVAGAPVLTASAPGPQRHGSRGLELSSAAAETLYLPCAGILLLHPFLKTLFHDRGLLDGRHFVDEPARQRAAQLLGYLASGNAQVPEYELGFAKLLTGIELETALESAWLEPADIAACDALLAAVLGHWTALRSSSAAWLRSQFFLRDGKLETVDGGYRVTVERRAQDVLLARLPWGFGVISLPWLQQRIFVQWLD